ncbi:MAG: hypothetical protein KC517_05925 [Bacteroidetes bacterium]|jgi:hypothetical protein|nr:hypothetical protein [Bacteroidota bacterium]
MKTHLLRLTIITLFVAICGTVTGQQKTVFPKKQGYLFDIQYGVQSPKGDLEDRFGWNSTLGFGARYKFESGWTAGFKYNWMFGNNVKERNMFDSIVGPTGEIFDKDGLFSVIRLNQRGHTLTMNGGRLFPVLKNNKNSGILVDVGFGFMLHRIDIFASSLTVPQVTEDYEKGYDRLSGGIALNQFIGYQHLDPKKRVNFQVGFSFQQAFTKSMRTIDFDTRTYNPLKRTDLLQGVRIGIILPVYTKKLSEEEYFID